MFPPPWPNFGTSIPTLLQSRKQTRAHFHLYSNRCLALPVWAFLQGSWGLRISMHATSAILVLRTTTRGYYVLTPWFRLSWHRMFTG